MSGNVPAVPQCTKIVQVESTDEFLARSNLITSAAIGFIITTGVSDAGSMDPGLVGPLASILTVEGKQDAFFRMVARLAPSASPLDTAIPDSWAVKLALDLVDPNSCPQIPAVEILPQLTVTNPPFTAKPMNPLPAEMSFTFDPVRVPNAAGTPLFIAWANQANIPI